MKYSNLISFVFILIFSLFETITAHAITNDSIPDDCKVVEEVINMIGNDLQKTYKNLNIINCCNFRQITCKNLNNQDVVTEIKFNNYKNLSNQDMGKIISQFAKLPHLTTLEMSNNIIVGELPNNLSELKKLQKLDLSGNCWKDKDASTKLIIEELNKCIISNKIVKEFSYNSLTMLSFCAMLIIIGVNIFIDAPNIFEDEERIKKWFFNIFFRHFGVTITNDLYSFIFKIIFMYGYFFFQFLTCFCLSYGFSERKLIYLKIFKYNYFAAIILQIKYKFRRSRNKKGKKIIRKKIILYVFELFSVIFSIVYYIHGVKLINLYGLF
jgi:hypothetical protein